MEKNVGGYDRGLRIVVGIVLLAAGLAALGGLFSFASGTAGVAVAVVVALVGAVLLATGAVQMCPINAALGIDTCEGRADQGGNGLGTGG